MVSQQYQSNSDGMGQNYPYSSSSDPRMNNGNDRNSNPLHTNRQLKAAVAAGGITGLVVGGPLLGVVAAGGAALAVTHPGKAGEIARAGGDAAAKVGDKIRKIKPQQVVDKGRQLVTQLKTKQQQKQRSSAEFSNASRPIY